MDPKEDGVTTYTFRIVVELDEDRWRAYAPALEAQGIFERKQPPFPPG